MATVFNPTCSPAMNLRLSPLRSTISRPILRLSSSPKFTLNSCSSPKPYPYSPYRVRADCSGGGVSGSTGDDGHRQNDMTNSCPDRACGGMSPPSCSYASAENSPKSHLFRLWKYHYHSLVAMKSLPKYVLVVMGLKALCGSTYAASLIIAIGKCVGIVSTLGDFPKVIHKVPFLADLKPSGKNVMEHVHKETIRPVGYPSGAVPDIQITYPVVAVALLKRGRSCLEVGGGVLRRGMTFLEVVVALLRRGVTCLEAVVGILRRGMTSLEAVVGILRRAMTCLEAVVGILRRAMTFLE